MDRDNRQVGRLMAGYLLKQRVAHVAVLLRDRLTQGDHLVADAVRDTLAEAGLPLTALTIRGLPSDAKAAVAEIGVLLDTCPKPIGLLCRGLPLAQAAEAAFQARDLPANKRPTLAVCDLFGEASRNPLYPHARPMLSPQQWGKRLGQLLACQVRGERPEADHELVPVELALP